MEEQVEPNILVVDHAGRCAEELARRLREHYERVWMAHDGKTARAVAYEQRPWRALVFVDAIGCFDGEDLIAQVRQTSRRTAVLALTDHATGPIACAALARGATWCVSRTTDPALIEIGFGARDVLLSKRPAETLETPPFEAIKLEYAHTVLIITGGNQSLAAARLRIQRETLRSWLQAPPPPECKRIRLEPPRARNTPIAE
jgi:ActR/RegA family two-component response regulator